MIVGIPKEIAPFEHRVGVVPANVKSLIRLGNNVKIETGAGEAIGIYDIDYKKAGAQIVKTAKEIYEGSEIIVKVMEPKKEEYQYLQKGQILLSYLHLAVDEPLLNILLKKGVTSIAYETIQLSNGYRPTLAPMSEIAGRMATQLGAHYLQSNEGGRGTLLGGVPGVKKGRVTVIGAGVVGQNAIQMALGMGAYVVALDTDVSKLRDLENRYRGQIQTLYSNTLNIEEALFQSHVVVGAVLVQGTKSPILIKKDYLKMMKKGAVIVDVGIDQGGITETIKPTTFNNPVFEEDNIIHYALPNMPGTVARTSTFALTNATIPYIKSITSMGLKKSVEIQPELGRGINTHNHHLTCKEVAKELNYKYYPLKF